jgi:hypothetical protein
MRGDACTGTEADRSTVDYSLAGTEAAKVFNSMAALGIIAFTFGALPKAALQQSVLARCGAASVQQRCHAHRAVPHQSVTRDSGRHSNMLLTRMLTCCAGDTLLPEVCQLLQAQTRLLRPHIAHRSL